MSDNPVYGVISKLIKLLINLLLILIFHHLRRRTVGNYPFFKKLNTVALLLAFRVVEKKC